MRTLATLSTLAFAAFIVLASACDGGGGGDAPTAEPSPTATPEEPTPEVRVTESPDAADALLAAHFVATTSQGLQIEFSVSPDALVLDSYRLMATMTCTVPAEGLELTEITERAEVEGQPERVLPELVLRLAEEASAAADQLNYDAEASVPEGSEVAPIVAGKFRYHEQGVTFSGTIESPSFASGTLRIQKEASDVPAGLYGQSETFGPCDTGEVTWSMAGGGS